MKHTADAQGGTSHGTAHQVCDLRALHPAAPVSPAVARSGTTSTPAAPWRKHDSTYERACGGQLGEAASALAWGHQASRSSFPPDVCVFCGAQLLCGGPLLSMPCSLPAPVGSDMGNLALLGTVLMPRHLPNRTGKQLPGQQATGFNAVHTRSVRHPSSTGGPALQLTAPLSPCGHTHASLM